MFVEKKMYVYLRQEFNNSYNLKKKISMENNSDFVKANILAAGANNTYTENGA